MTTRITSRRRLAMNLIERQPSLADVGLHTVPDESISLNTHFTYCIANEGRVKDMIARVMVGLQTECGANAKLLRTLFRNVSSEKTAVGFLAQFQGYDWLLGQGTSFVAEVQHDHTIRRRTIELDGRIDTLSQPVFFDIKSVGFEPAMRQTFQQRLEKEFPGHTFTIDGPGNHGLDEIQAEVFANLRDHLTALQNSNRLNISALGWVVTKEVRRPSVRSAAHSYDPDKFGRANREVPLRFASQFTTDTPYILMFVLPDGIGSSPLHRNVFKFSEKVIDGIARHLFSSGRADQTSANQHSAEVPADVKVADVILRLSALVLYSPQADVTFAHINNRAAAPLTKKDADLIASGWKVTSHP